MINKSINGDETKTSKVLKGHTNSFRHYSLSGSSQWKDLGGLY